MAKKEKIDALVPIEEQPYLVPENWRWVRLGSVCKFIGGGTPSKDVSSYWNGDIPWASVKDIKGDFLYDTIDHITPKGLNNSAANLCEIDDLLLVTRIEPGKTIIAKTESAINQDLKIVKSEIIPSFLHYYFKNFQHVFMLKASGSTVKGITVQNVENTEIPLPTHQEQQRIINRIESLFAKLDEAKEKAQAVVDGLEDRKAAILHKAFTGELTEEWRKKQTTRVVEWKQATFDDIIVSIKNGTTAKQNKETNNYPVTRIESLQRGTIDFSRLGYIVDPTTISEEDYYRENDIALSHINSAAHVGKTALIRASFLPLVHGMNLLRIRLNSLCIPEFFVWYSRSVEYKEQITQRINMAVNQVSINQKQLRTMPIPIPQIREQEIIVKILNENIYKLEQVKDTAEQVVSQIDTMKKAILAHAFRGELGTNDPSEPPVDIGIS